MNETSSSTKRELSLKRVAKDGLVMSVAQGALIVGSILYNPEIWHDDYPPEVKAKAAAMSRKAKRQRAMLIVPAMLGFFGPAVHSNLKLREENGGKLTFGAAFLNAYGVFAVFNLFDLVALDYLFAYKLRPRRMVLPGTEGMAAYDDFSFHVRGFFKGLGFGLVPSLMIAVGTRSRTKDQGQ